MPGFAKLIASCCVFLLLSGVAAPAAVETMDDASIRKFYTDLDTDMLNPRALLKTVNGRWDTGYMMDLKLGTIIESGPPKMLRQAMSKSDITDFIIKSSFYMVVNNVYHNISSIQIYKANTLAYVTYTLAGSGDLQITGNTARSILTINFNAAASCVDTLALINNLITVQRSQCDAQNLILKTD